jgi:hypothetical protein
MTRPVLNHVAVTMPAELLDERGRKEIVDFYGEVFGWQPFDTNEESNPLVMGTGPFGQFVYLVAGDPPLVPGSFDHFGLMVETEAELDEILARAKRYRDRDDRVRIVEKKSDVPQKSSIGYTTLTNCYIGFVLPLQYIHVEPFAERAPATSGQASR